MVVVSYGCNGGCWVAGCWVAGRKAIGSALPVLGCAPQSPLYARIRLARSAAAQKNAEKLSDDRNMSLRLFPYYLNCANKAVEDSKKFPGAKERREAPRSLRRAVRPPNEATPGILYGNYSRMKP